MHGQKKNRKRYSNAEDSAGWLGTLNYIVHILIHVRLNLLV